MRALRRAIPLLAALANGAAAAAQDDPLAAAFAHPPDAARLRMYWRVFGPAWRDDEIDFELEEVKRAGVGGIVVYFLYPVALDDAEHGVVNQRFLSPEFLATFRHAAEKAQALGLRFSVNGGTGWPFGGPTVAPTESAQRLRVESLAPDRDGGGFALPELKQDERLVRATIDGRDVTAALRAGRVEAPTGAPLTLFLAGPTGMQVKRAAFGGEGLVVDHLSHAAVERWLDANVAPLLAVNGPADPSQRPLVQSIGCDSLEVYGANWSEALPVVFARRRGYELLPWLPRWADVQDPSSADLRFDFWRTVAELAEEECVEPMAKWAHAHGVALELEAYGTPPLPLTAARSIDVPTGEHYEWKALSVARLAAAGAHLAGRRTIGAEAWTWAGIPNRLADTLGDLKLLSDFHFLSGANDLVGVDFPYSPRSAGAPGWLPYYGPCFNWNHPQWPFFTAFSDYVARCQLLLREGRPVADVLVYLPVEDCFARGPTDQMLLDFALRDHFVTGRPTTEFGLKNALTHHSNLVHALLTHGFDFDAIDFWALDRLAQVDDGALVAGAGRYATLVLHDVERIEPVALEKMVEFARRGGRVIATRRIPERAAGLHAPEVQAHVAALIDELFGAELVRASRDPERLGRGVRLDHVCGRGRATFASDDAGQFLAALSSCEPRLRIEPWSAELAFVERELADRDLFFLVNASERATSFRATLRTGHARAALWQPLDGTITPLPSRSRAAGSLEVALELPPHGSTFVVVAGTAADAGAAASAAVDTPAPVATTRRALDGPWHVTFDGPDAPPPRDVATLASWSEWADARNFSGRATYACDFAVAEPLPWRATLVLPQVRDACEVRVNGVAAGVRFTPPFEVDVAPLLRGGANRVEITVGNLPVNRFVSLPDADLAALRREFGNRFPAPEEKRLVPAPLPSGLVGTVEFATDDAALHEPLVVTQDLVLGRNVVLERPLLIRASHVTIDGNGATLRGPGRAGDPRRFRGTGISADGCSDVTIRNLNVHGFRVGLAASNGARWNVEDCDFSRNYHDPDFGWGEVGRFGGIVLTRMTRSVLRDCKANENWNGLDLDECDDNLITRCDFSHASNTCAKLTTSRRNSFAENDLSWGLRIAPGETHARDSACILIESGSDENQFDRNDVTHGGDGLFIRLMTGWVSQRNVFRDNDFSFAHNNCVECWSPRNWFQHNRANHGSYGFWLAGSHEIRLIDNEVAWNGAPDGFHNATEAGFGNGGIVMAGVSASHVVLEGNRIHDNGGAGIAFRGDEASAGKAWRIRHWVVQDNRIERNRYGIWGRFGDSIFVGRNAFRDNAGGNHFDDVTSLVEATDDGGGAQAPRALLDAPTHAVVGEPVTFDGSRSEGRNGRPLAFRFDVDGAITTEPKVVRSFDRPGLHSIELTVSDGSLADLAALDLIVAAPVDHEIGTEGDAAKWGFEMEGNEDGKGRVLFADDEDAVVGRRSLRFRPDPYKGMYATAVYPASRDAGWNLETKRFLSFWIRAENRNVGGFQNPGPVLHLYGPAGELALEPSAGRNLLLTPARNEERWSWRLLRVPLRDDAEWKTTRKGTFEWSRVDAIGIALDSWCGDPFTIRIDGLAFDDG